MRSNSSSTTYFCWDDSVYNYDDYYYWVAKLDVYGRGTDSEVLYEKRDKLLSPEKASSISFVGSLDYYYYFEYLLINEVWLQKISEFCCCKWQNIFEMYIIIIRCVSTSIRKIDKKKNILCPNM